MAVAAGGKSKLMKAIKKPAGTIAIMAEIKRKDPGTPDLEFPIPSIQELSQCLNTAKVQSIAVWTDEQVVTPRLSFVSHLQLLALSEACCLAPRCLRRFLS